MSVALSDREKCASHAALWKLSPPSQPNPPIRPVDIRLCNLNSQCYSVVVGRNKTSPPPPRPNKAKKVDDLTVNLFFSFLCLLSTNSAPLSLLPGQTGSPPPPKKKEATNDNLEGAYMHGGVFVGKRDTA